MRRALLPALLAAALPGHALLGGDDPVPSRSALGSYQPACGAGPSALRENPALLALGGGGEVGAGFSRAFGIGELPVGAAWAGWGNGRWGAGAWWRQSRAGDLFREDLVVAGGALRRGDWALGGAAEAVQVSFAEGLGSAWALDASVGVWGRPLPWLALGGSARQLLGAEVGRSGEGLVRDALAGVAVSSPDGRFETAVSCRMAADAGTRPSWQAGQTVRLAPWLALRGGVRLEPLVLAAGLGTAWGGVALDAGLAGEERLGWQGTVALAWGF